MTPDRRAAKSGFDARRNHQPVSDLGNARTHSSDQIALIAHLMRGPVMHAYKSGRTCQRKLV